MKLLSFKGRTRRRDYWLISFGVGIGLSFGEIFAETYPLLYLIIFIPLFWISIANGAKRCHDLGHNGWWQLIPLYCFWMAFQDGQSIANEYGPSPKDTEIGVYKD